MQVGPCIPVGIQLEKAAVGPTSGPTWRLSHLVLVHARADQHDHDAVVLRQQLAQHGVGLGFGRIVASDIEAPNMFIVNNLV